jgi:hypothetical protein
MKPTRRGEQTTDADDEDHLSPVLYGGRPLRRTKHPRNGSHPDSIAAALKMSHGACESTGEGRLS